MNRINKVFEKFHFSTKMKLGYGKIKSEYGSAEIYSYYKTMDFDYPGTIVPVSDLQNSLCYTSVADTDYDLARA